MEYNTPSIEENLQSICQESPGGRTATLRGELLTRRGENLSSIPNLTIENILLPLKEEEVKIFDQYQTLPLKIFHCLFNKEEEVQIIQTTKTH